MHDVVWGSDGAGVPRRIVGGRSGQREAGGARTRPTPFPAGQYALAGHVETYRRDRYVELVADRLEGLASRDALCGTSQFFIGAPYAAVRGTGQPLQEIGWKEEEKIGEFAVSWYVGEYILFSMVKYLTFDRIVRIYWWLQ